MAYTTINKSTDYFNTHLYTGTGSSSAKTGVGFQPDFSWFKNRGTTNWNNSYDAVRGVTKALATNDNAAEDTRANGLTAFDSDGFTLGDDANVNANTNNYVSWNWKANGAGSLNEVGSIDSTVSVNTTSGFSIVKWTGNGVAGATIGHGLGVVPKMIIVKRLNDTANWTVYHVSLGNTHRLELNTTGTDASDAGAWDNTSPTTTVFSTGNNLTVGNNGSNYVAYCFADVVGYSKCGIYTGNGSTNGSFVHLGFKPAFFMCKGMATINWQVFDNKRSNQDGFNINDEVLAPNTDGAEYDEGSSAWGADFLSNGFKPRGDWAGFNTSGREYYYLAFGHSLVGSNKIRATPR